MSVLCRGDEFVVREVIGDSDLAQLVAWGLADRTVDFFQDVSVSSLRDRFAEEDSAGRDILHCIVEFQGRPLGYLEMYPSLFWFHVHGDVPGERPWGMDILIGDPDDRDKGLGSRLLRQVAHYLLRERGATRVIVDPVASNVRAVRCYEKAGFKKARFVPGSVTDGVEYEDTWLMEFEDESARE